MPTQLAPCPLRLPSALSPRRYDHQPVAIFDEPALVRVPRTAHVLPATPLAYNPCPCTLRHPRGLVSPGSRTGPSSMLSRRPPLPWQVRVGDPQAASVALSDAVAPARRRSARRRRLLRRAPSFPGALTLPAGRGRPCAPPPSLGLLTPPPPRLVDAGSTASCVRRLCGVL